VGLLAQLALVAGRADDLALKNDHRADRRRPGWRRGRLAQGEAHEVLVTGKLVLAHGPRMPGLTEDIKTLPAATVTPPRLSLTSTTAGAAGVAFFFDGGIIHHFLMT